MARQAILYVVGKVRDTARAVGDALMAGLIDVPAEFDERVAGLLCAALAGHRRPARRDGLAAMWSAEANRERLQAVDEAAGAPA